MGNVTTKSHRSKSFSVSGTSRTPRWDGPGLPAPPGKPILIPGTDDSQPDVVGIRWERSPSNGGSAIVGYLVEHRRLGSPHWLRSTPVLCTFPELTLSGLEPGWRYQFRVRAQNAVGFSPPSEISDPLTVTLQRATACSPKFEQELADTTALENDHTEFVVRFSGTPLPKISWFKDGFEIFSSRRTRIITENGRSVLLIHQTALNDEGEIKCTATNRAGHVSTKARLTLEASPRIRLPRQYEDGLLFEQGETIRLKVTLAGRPPPTVTWLHNGDAVPNDGRHAFETMDNEATLKIPDATREDRGEYTVKATNKLGENTASFLVTVTGRPAAPGKANVTMTLGRSVSLSWKEPNDDGGCKIGTYIVEYYRIGWDVWLKAATSRQTTANLTELIEGSEYKFRVKAENPYGISDPSEESDVIFIPDLKRGITSPSLTTKSQSHREIRSRAEKREVSFAEPPQRSRSLTREEAMSRDIDGNRRLDPAERSASAQRLSGRPSRADSRVTFAPDPTVLAPIPPARTKDHAKHNDNVGNHVNRGSVNVEAPEDLIRPKERPTSPKTITTVTISPPRDEPSTRRSILRDSRSRSLSMSRERSLSPPPMPEIKEHREEEDSPHLLRPTVLRKQNVVLGEPHDSLVVKRLSSIDDRTRSPSMPREDDESAMHGSSEFMLVLYPDDDDQKKSGKNNLSEDSERNLLGARRSTVEEIEDEEDLIPPPMSLSLPELFSADHEVVETLREAVSSTELLHERAMERFYRAVAAEEATETAKRKSLLERKTGELATSKREEESRIRMMDLKEGDVDSGPLESRRSSLRRRLSNSGVTSQNLIASWQAKRNRRRSSEGQTETAVKTPMKLLSPIFLADIEARSDPNLPAEVQSSIVEPWRRSNDEGAVERLRRWHDSNIPLVEEIENEKPVERRSSIDKALPVSAQKSDEAENQQVSVIGREESKEEGEEEEESVETSEESSEELSSADSEDLKLLKARILARQVMDEEDTYHPRGKPIPHVQPEPEPVSPVPPVSPTNSNIVPKSILKKRPEEPVPVNSFGRPVPPEKPIRQFPPQSRVDEPSDSTKKSLMNMPEVMKTPIMSESDTDSILNAAEAAKSRRIQAKMRSVTPEDEPNEADIEARMAVVNHYTEIVREHSHQKDERRMTEEVPTVRRSSISEDQGAQRKLEDRGEDKITVKPSSRKEMHKNRNELERQDSEQPSSRRNSIGSRGTTPARDAKVAKDTQRGRPSSRTQSPSSRSRNVSTERGGTSSRSSSKTRLRATSQDRSTRASSRAPSEEPHFVKEKSVEPSTRRSKASSRPSSRPSSRAHSRSSSRDRHRATTPVETKIERLQKALESKKYRALRRGSDVDQNYPEELRANRLSDEQLAAQAEVTVRSTVSYIIDLTLLIAAAYVYLFKKETLAIPFIALLLYRRIQEGVYGMLPRRWWPFGRKR